MLVKTIHKTAWLAGGIFLLLLAVIGLMLPIIPQMPFFIASVVCFARCSPRFNKWLCRQHWFTRLHDWAVKQRWFDYIKNHLPHPHHRKKHPPSGVD